MRRSVQRRKQKLRSRLKVRCSNSTTKRKPMTKIPQQPKHRRKSWLPMQRQKLPNLWFRGSKRPSLRLLSFCLKGSKRPKRTRTRLQLQRRGPLKIWLALRKSEIRLPRMKLRKRQRERRPPKMLWQVVRLQLPPPKKPERRRQQRLRRRVLLLLPPPRLPERRRPKKTKQVQR